MKKGKRGQASLIAVILLLVLIMVFVVIAVVILLVNPSIIGFVSQTQPEQTQPEIIIRTVQLTPSQPLCSYPYTQVGNSCCLDKNYNRICDSDEIQRQNIEYCIRPYIRDGTACCLDNNYNYVCDQYEFRRHYYYRSSNRVDSSYLNFPFDLSDLQISSNEIWMRISNIGDYDYIITSIDIEGCDKINTNKIIQEGDDQTFTATCPTDRSDRDVTIESKRSGSDTIIISGGRIREN